MLALPPSVVISTDSDVGIADVLMAWVTTAVAGQTWPTANKAFYIPITITSPITVAYMMTRISTVSSGNVDVGLYSVDGTRILSSGSTGAGTVNVVQSFNVTDTVIGPGVYYLAMACDNTTATFLAWIPALQALRGAGVMEQTSAFPLPATATFATLTSNFVPCVGLSQRSFV